jgi:hypothetical protein
MGKLGIAPVCMLYEMPDRNRDVECSIAEGQAIPESCGAPADGDHRNPQEHQNADPEDEVGSHLVCRALEVVMGEVPLKIDEPTDDENRDRDPQRGERLLPDVADHGLAVVVAASMHEAHHQPHPDDAHANHARRCASDREWIH